jgi:hypothetical protein
MGEEKNMNPKDLDQPVPEDLRIALAAKFRRMASDYGKIARAIEHGATLFEIANLVRAAAVKAGASTDDVRTGADLLDTIPVPLVRSVK